MKLLWLPSKELLKHLQKNPTKYVVEASVSKTNDDGTFGVEKAYLAKVGDTSYYMMDEAFHAALNFGPDAYLLRDYTTGTEAELGSKNLTINLGGHTWTYTGKDTSCAVFEINYSDVTLTALKKKKKKKKNLSLSMAQ